MSSQPPDIQRLSATSPILTPLPFAAPVLARLPMEAQVFIHEFREPLRTGVPSALESSPDAFPVYMELLLAGGDVPLWAEEVIEFVKPHSTSLIPAKRRSLFELACILSPLFAKAWCRETALPIDRHGSLNRPAGYSQSAPTALVVNDLLEYPITQCVVQGYGLYYFNRPLEKEELHLIGIEKRPDAHRFRVNDVNREEWLASEYAKHAKINERYQVLRDRVRMVAAATAIACISALQNPVHRVRRTSVPPPSAA